jgi:hypothetical protein
MKRIEFSDGSYLNYPTHDLLLEFIEGLSETAEFLVLTDTHQGFVQVMWGPRMGEPAGTFVIETKGPHVERQVRTVIDGRSSVEDVFGRFLNDDTSWVGDHEWEPVDVSSP